MWTYNYTNPDVIAHFGIKGMKWGVRRYQNSDGSLTNAGKKRRAQLDSYIKDETKDYKRSKKQLDEANRDLADLKKNGVKSEAYKRELAARQRNNAMYRREGMRGKELAEFTQSTDSKSVLKGATEAARSRQARYSRESTQIQKGINLLKKADLSDKTYMDITKDSYHRSKGRSMVGIAMVAGGLGTSLLGGSLATKAIGIGATIVGSGLGITSLASYQPKELTREQALKEAGTKK